MYSRKKKSKPKKNRTNMDIEYIFSFEKLKPLFNDFVMKCPNEVGINYIDNENVEITMGTPTQTISIYKYILDIHTHPFSLQRSRNSIYNPPSHADYWLSLTHFHANRFSFAITPEGLWIYKPAQSLISFFMEEIPDYPYDIIGETYNVPGNPFKTFSDGSNLKLSREAFNTYENIEDVLSSNVNLYNCKLARGDEIENEYKKNDMFSPIDVSTYIEEMSNIIDDGIGFIVRLIPWDKEWNFRMEITKDTNKEFNNIKKETIERDNIININEFSYNELEPLIIDTEAYYPIIPNNLYDY